MVGEEKSEDRSCQAAPAVRWARAFSGWLTVGLHSRMRAVQGHCLLPSFYKNVFYRWIKAYKMGKNVWGGGGKDYLGSIQIKIKKTNDRLMPFIYRLERGGNNIFGPLYLWAIIRSGYWENKTLCFLNLYFFIFHGTGHEKHVLPSSMCLPHAWIVRRNVVCLDTGDAGFYGDFWALVPTPAGSR